jgi:hypothetical protein
VYIRSPQSVKEVLCSMCLQTHSYITCALNLDIQNSNESDAFGERCSCFCLHAVSNLLISRLLKLIRGAVSTKL